jgi:ubiquinone/menaquinone biosynthesis C-methylase UbiE
MNLKNIISKLKVLLKNYKFCLLQKYGLCNIKVNNIVYPVNYIAGKNVKVEFLNINKVEVDKVTSINPRLTKNASNGYPYSKTLEYLVSLKLHDFQNGFKLLDAAGGAEAQFAQLAKKYTSANIQVFCQDSIPLLENRYSNIQYITGSIDSVPLEDGFIDGITCHHSFEHFSQNLDQKFILESLRILKVGGKLVIVPLFITNIYSEITNQKNYKLWDNSAHLIYDKTASFSGWGPYEGFARTYDVESFNKRILSIVPRCHKVSIYNILFEDKPSLDLTKVNYQPSLNALMKALVIEKK